MKKLLILLVVFTVTPAWAQNCGIPPDRDPQLMYAGEALRRIALENYYRCLEQNANQQRLNDIQMQQYRNQQMQQQSPPIWVQPPPVLDIRR